MRLISLIRQEVPDNLRAILFMNVLSAIAVTVLLWVIGQASQEAAAGVPKISLLLMYGAAVLLVQITHNYVLVTAAQDAERMVHHIRIRLFDAIRQADLQVIQKLGRSTLNRALCQDTQILSGTLPLLGIAVQQAIILIFLGAYLAWMSPLACLMAFGFAAVAVLARFRRTKALRYRMKKVTVSGTKVFDSLRDLLGGFKEIRMDPLKAAGVIQRHAEASDDYRAGNIAIKSEWGRNFAVVEALLYIQIGLMVFAVPLLTTDFHLLVVPATTAVLFIIGPVGTLAYVTPMLSQAELAINNIEQTERDLAAARVVQLGGPPAQTNLQLTSIALQSATFSFSDAAGTPSFSVGPLSATFAAGEITFVTGGNGSGKSTMLRLLTGLLPLRTGSLLLNGRTVESVGIQSYRDCISAIFSDFHIARRLYGLQNVDEVRVRELLEKFEIAHKVEFEDGAFSTRSLSTGQKRRLAMVAALLENKPVIILDEWAADQDPHFRKVFYESVIPALKAQGKIVICVTHDDRWFPVADQIIHMTDGTVAR